MSKTNLLTDTNGEEIMCTQNQIAQLQAANEQLQRRQQILERRQYDKEQSDDCWLNVLLCIFCPCCLICKLCIENDK